MSKGPFLLIRLKKNFTGTLQCVQKISHQVPGFSHMVWKKPGAAAQLLHRVQQQGFRGQGGELALHLLLA